MNRQITIKTYDSKFHRELMFETCAGRIDVYFKGVFFIRIFCGPRNYKDVLAALERVSKPFNLNTDQDAWLTQLDQLNIVTR